MQDGHEHTEPNIGRGQKILVLSPWGLAGGYSGPLVLLDRLFSAVVAIGEASVDVLYRDRGLTRTPLWVKDAYPLAVTGASTFSLFQRLRWIARTRWFLMRRAGDYDVIHVHGAYLLNIMPFIGLACRRKIAVLPVLDGGDLTTRQSGILLWLKTALLRHVLGHASCGLSLASGIAEDLVSLGLPEDRVFDFPNVVDVDEFVPCPRPSGGLQTQFTLGFVGKMGETKQPHLVLEALKDLQLSGVDAKAIFVGPFANAEYEEKFFAAAEGHDVVDRVRVVGYQEDVSPFFREMDVFVLPSSAEGMPGALVEAMASGIPVVVTDVGSMRKIVDEAEAGYVVPASGKAIAEAAKAIQENDSLREGFSSAAREFAMQNFSKKAVAKIYLSATQMFRSTANS